MTTTIYMVGGCVRDALLLERCGAAGADATKSIAGIASCCGGGDDVDYVVDGIDYNDLPALMTKMNKEILHNKPTFLAMRVRDKTTKRVEDFAVCRKDTYSAPTLNTLPTISPGTILDDLTRRDFTMNAIAFNMDTHEYIDPYGGRNDIANGLIKCVGNARQRLLEDCVRLIRCFRFHVKYDLRIDESIWNVIANNRNELVDAFRNIPRSRIVNELQKLFATNLVKSIQLLGRLDAHLLQSILMQTQIKIFLS